MLSCSWSLLFTFFFKNWVPSPQFWIQTHLIGLIWSNDADCPRRNLLAWRRCRNPIARSRALLATQNRGFASWVGGGMPPLPSDTKTRVSRNANLVCAVQQSCVMGMAGLAPPGPKRKTKVLCRRREGACTPPLPKTRSDPKSLWNMSRLQISNSFLFSLTRTAK